MTTKKIIPCLDIMDGRVVKGVNFLDLKDVSSPVDLAKLYSDSGADELVFYDITASVEGRKIFTELLKQVAACTTVPLTAGGGISTLDDFDVALGCGAEKVSINSGALKNPELISSAARKYGSQCVVLAADVKRVDGVFRVFTKGGKEDTGLDFIEWIKRGESLGAGELVINSIDTDGVKGGFDLPMLRATCDAVSIPVVASGGAGSIADFVELFKTLPEVAAGLAASVFHFGDVKIPELKRALHDNGISVTL
jgi:cyclase